MYVRALECVQNVSHIHRGSQFSNTQLLHIRSLVLSAVRQLQSTRHLQHHPKVKIPPSFTHSHGISNLHDVLSSVVVKYKIFSRTTIYKNKVNGDQNRLFGNIL